MKQEKVPTLKINDIVLVKQYPEAIIEKGLEITKSKGGTELAKPVLQSIKRHSATYGADTSMPTATVYDQKGNIIAHTATPLVWKMNDAYNGPDYDRHRLSFDESTWENNQQHLMFCNGEKLFTHPVHKRFIDSKTEDGEYSLRSVTQTTEKYEVTVSRHNDFSEENESDYLSLTNKLSIYNRDYERAITPSTNEVESALVDFAIEQGYNPETYVSSGKWKNDPARDFLATQTDYNVYNVYQALEGDMTESNVKDLGEFKTWMNREHPEIYKQAEKGNMKLTIRNKEPNNVDRSKFSNGVDFENYDFENNHEFYINEKDYHITDGINDYGICPKGKNPYGKDYDSPEAGGKKPSELNTIDHRGYPDQSGYLVDDDGNRYGRYDEDKGEYVYPERYHNSWNRYSGKEGWVRQI